MKVKCVYRLIVAVAVLTLLALPVLAVPYAVSGGTVRAVTTDAMVEYRPAPNGYIGCYAYTIPTEDNIYSMVFDIGSKPTEAVAAILLQNTTEYATWRVAGKVNILVSSHEDEPGFDPSNTALYDTTVLSNGTVMPTATPSNQEGLQAGLWRYAALTTHVVKRFYLIQVTECPDGLITEDGKNYFFIGDVNYAFATPAPPLDGYNVTGGVITALGTDGMAENRPAPDGYFACGVDSAAGHDRYTMCLDIGSKPVDTVKAILIQNTTEFTTWRVVGKVNIKVSSHEDEYGFNPENASLYDTTVLSGGTVLPTATVTPWDMSGLEAGAWRTAALTTPVAKRFFLVEVTECPDGPVTEAGKNYFFIGDVNYTTEVPPIDIDGITVTGGEICALGTDAMVENRPAPNGYIGCYAAQQADSSYTMLFDLLNKPADTVKAILLQNTTEFTTWRVAGKVTVKVSSHEDEYGFDPKNTSLYDTTVLSNGTVLPTASVDPWVQDGLQAGAWRTAALTTPVAKRFFLVEVTECPDGPISNADTSYFFLGDANYTTVVPPIDINGIAVTGGEICALGSDAMVENRPAPNGYITCGVDSAAGHDRYSMLFDIGSKPAQTVTAIKIQNTTEFTTWRVVGKVNVKVSSHEDEYGFNAKNTSLYDTTVLSGGTVMPTASIDPWNMAGLEAGAWRTAALTVPVAKRFYLIEVTHCPDGPVTEGGKNYFFIGDMDYSFTPMPFPPAMGASNKAVLDAIMTSAAPNYTWVLWGKVTVIDSDSFTIDDGSGVNIEVSAPGYADLGVVNGSYVSVYGAFDTTTRILLSRGINKYN